MVAPADQVRSGRNAAVLVPVLPQWPDSVCDWSAPVNCYPSSYVTACGLYAHPLLLNCLNHSPVQHLPGVQSLFCSGHLQLTATH